MLNKLMYILKKKFYRDIGEYDVTIEQLKKMQKNGTVIIDVRSPQEFMESHIEGSISIPEYEVNLKIEKIIINKDQEIIVYCGSGSRSKRVQKRLRNMGYKNVYNLYNGTENY